MPSSIQASFTGHSHATTSLICILICTPLSHTHNTYTAHSHILHTTLTHTSHLWIILIHPIHITQAPHMTLMNTPHHLPQSHILLTYMPNMPHLHIWHTHIHSSHRLQSHKYHLSEHRGNPMWPVLSPSWERSFKEWLPYSVKQDVGFKPLPSLAPF